MTVINDNERLKRYIKVNNAASLEELATIIESFANEKGIINGRTRSFYAKIMANHCREFTITKHATLTREYGIRQQALMLLLYENA